MVKRGIQVLPIPRDESCNHNYIQIPYSLYFDTFSPINEAASFSGILRFMTHFSFFLYGKDTLQTLGNVLQSLVLT